MLSITVRRAMTAAALLALTLPCVTPWPAVGGVDVGGDMHTEYDVCIAKFTASGLRDLVDQLDKSANVFSIRRPKYHGTNNSNPESTSHAADGTGTGGTTKWDPTDTSPFEGDRVPADPCATLYHEMGHLAEYDKGIMRRDNCRYMQDGKEQDSGITVSEVMATRTENVYRLAQNPRLEKRTHYGIGKPLPDDAAVCLPTPPDPPPRGCSAGCAIGAGDPHLKTFDGLSYDFQALGEFVLTRASASDLEVQGRTSAPSGLRTVSLFSAAAAHVAGDRVGVYRTPGGLRIHIGGVATVVPAGVRQLPKGGAVEVFGGGVLEIRWPDGSALRVHTVGTTSISLSLYLAEARRGQVEGLFGNFDGKSEGDLVVRGGDAIGEKPSFETLYQIYGNSWRVSPAQSLFDYGPGESAETFTDRTFPDQRVAAADLPNRASAEAICRQAGVTEPTTLEGCILDVGLTGEIAFAHDAVTIQRLVATAGPATLSRGVTPVEVTTTQGTKIVFPAGEISFADAVVSYTPGDPAPKRSRDPKAAVGKPDYRGSDDAEDQKRYISLGHGGALVLKFTDNVLVDGEGPDLAIFEIGPAVEAMFVAISEDGKHWVEVGRVDGSTSTVDIAPFVKPGQHFRFVKLTDAKGGESINSDWPGADIDAVGAINTLP